MKIINTYEIKDNFKDISIVVNTAHVEIKESENSHIKVVCHERKKHAHNVRVEDSTLIISKKKRKWYSYLLPSFDKANITIYIPIKNTVPEKSARLGHHPVIMSHIFKKCLRVKFFMNEFFGCFTDET